VKTLIAKYLTSALSEEETEILRDWLKESKKNREEFKATVRANQELDYVLRTIDSEKAYDSILKKTTINNKWTFGKSRSIFKYAAVLLLIVGTSFLLYHILNVDASFGSNAQIESATEITLELEDGSLQILEENKRTAITNKEGEKVVSQEYGKIKYEDNKEIEGTELVYNQLTVPYGKRFEVELADGTIVYLNAGTKFKYPRLFTDPKSREVFLDGEAMFSVKKNASQPFIVHTEKMNVRVLGTKFNVSSYKNESNTSAVLVEGSVAVYRPSEIFDENKNVVLPPKHQAVFQEDDIIVQEVNVQKHIAWTTGKLYFVNDCFENIIKELERHFNIKIQNNYLDLNRTRYTGTFDSETIDQILDTFKKNSQFDYLKKNGEIIIEPTQEPTEFN
tara:strand:+ start:25805 stop:26980 length:1176 start_codon:yes stop_codon:yes gene_type:complete